MSDVGSAAPATRTGRGRRRWLTAGLIAVAVYLGVLVLYGSSTRLDVATDQLDIQPAEDAIVAVELVSVHPLGGTAEAMVRVLPPGKLLDGDLRLREDLEVQITSSFPTERDDQTRMGFEVAKLEFPRGSSLVSLVDAATLSMEGRYQDYPYDVFRTTLVAQASGPSGAIPSTRLEVLGDVPSWLIRGQEVGVPLVSVADVELVRAGSTKTFVILLLVAMLVLGVLALLVSFAVITGRRKVEATMASWFAGMLFALIPLRLNLPGAPPIGVWMDFIVVLWVLLAIMVGLALFMTAWLRRTPPPDAPAPR